MPGGRAAVILSLAESCDWHVGTDDMANGLKTALLLGLLSGLLLVIGESLGGANGLVIAFLFAAVMNFGSYWFSDKIVLRMYRAQEVGPGHRLYKIVERLVPAGDPADAEGVHDSGSVAERVCDRPQSRARRGGRHRRHSAGPDATPSSKASSRTSWRT